MWPVGINSYINIATGQEANNPIKKFSTETNIIELTLKEFTRDCIKNSRQIENIPDNRSSFLKFSQCSKLFAENIFYMSKTAFPVSLEIISIFGHLQRRTSFWKSLFLRNFNFDIKKRTKPSFKFYFCFRNIGNMFHP